MDQTHWQACAPRSKPPLTQGFKKVSFSPMFGDLPAAADEEINKQIYCCSLCSASTAYNFWKACEDVAVIWLL